MAAVNQQSRIADKRFLNIIKKSIKSLEGHKSATIIPDGDDITRYYIRLIPENIHSSYYKQEHYLYCQTKYGCNAFPSNPPNIRFLTGIYHPNISSKGSICMDIFTDIAKWSPLYKFDHIINSILLLIDAPNSSSPYNANAAVLWTRCHKRFKEQICDKKMSVTNEDELRNKCFNSYNNECKLYYNRNNGDIDKYRRLFSIL